MSLNGRIVAGNTDDCQSVDNRMVETAQQLLSANIGTQIDPYLMVYLMSQYQLNSAINHEKLNQAPPLQQAQLIGNSEGQPFSISANHGANNNNQCLAGNWPTPELLPQMNTQPVNQSLQLQQQLQQYQRLQQFQIQLEQHQLQQQQQQQHHLQQQQYQLHQHQHQQLQQQQQQQQQQQSRSGRRHRAAHAPTKPPNAFIIFRRERAAEIRSEDPKIKNGDISKLTGKEWREASPILKDAYRRKAEDIKRDTSSTGSPTDLVASSCFDY
ncbi:hypothetical protein BDF22DRAFT_652449 [Syncephalis plumigaleata]|nr:hypothetical protein BDF22DRAFT_652449 [Syncephalis plumigaleata]